MGRRTNIAPSAKASVLGALRSTCNEIDNALSIITTTCKETGAEMLPLEELAFIRLTNTVEEFRALVKIIRNTKK